MPNSVSLRASAADGGYGASSPVLHKKTWCRDRALWGSRPVSTKPSVWDPGKTGNRGPLQIHAALGWAALGWAEALCP